MTAHPLEHMRFGCRSLASPKQSVANDPPCRAGDLLKRGAARLAENGATAAKAPVFRARIPAFRGEKYDPSKTFQDGRLRHKIVICFARA
jgi:hypothetical protein